MKMISYKKPRLMGNTFASKTKLTRCRRREKEDRIPGQKVGRSSWIPHGMSSGLQLLLLPERLL